MRRFCLLWCAFGCIGAQGQTIIVTPETPDLQKLVLSQPAGTKFVFGAGTYRSVSSLHPKSGDIFEAQPGAILNGSERLNFAPAAALWSAAVHGTSKEQIFQTSPCSGYLKNADGSHYSIGCTHTRTLFFDDQPLWRVDRLQDVTPDTWFFDDASQKAYIGRDPQGHILELSELPDAISGEASDVTVRGFTIKRYATGQQHGAITCDQKRVKDLGAQGWLIEGNTIVENHYSGVEIVACSRSRILNNMFSRNGDLGLAVVSSDDVLVEGNEIALNNYANFDSGWEAGGAKFVDDSNLTVRKNKAHDNRGTGLWADIDCKEATFTGNDTTSNADNGIFYEISSNAVIENNVSKLNGIGSKGHDPWAYDGQIVVSASHGVTVRNNTVVVGPYGNGITIIQQPRGDGKYGPHVSTDNTVEHNDITFLSDFGTSGVAYDPFTFKAKNNFDFNTYHTMRQDIHFRLPAVAGWKEFVASGQELHGRIGK